MGPIFALTTLSLHGNFVWNSIGHLIINKVHFLCRVALNSE